MLKALEDLIKNQDLLERQKIVHTIHFMITQLGTIHQISNFSKTEEKLVKRLKNILSLVERDRILEKIQKITEKTDKILNSNARRFIDL